MWCLKGEEKGSGALAERLKMWKVQDTEWFGGFRKQTERKPSEFGRHCNCSPDYFGHMCWPKSWPWPVRPYLTWLAMTVTYLNSSAALTPPSPPPHFLSTSSSLLQLRWPPFCSSNIQSMLLPQGLCSCRSLCLFSSSKSLYGSLLASLRSLLKSHHLSENFLAILLKFHTIHLPDPAIQYLISPFPSFPPPPLWHNSP